MTSRSKDERRQAAQVQPSGTVFAPLIGMLWRTLESYGIPPNEVIPQPLYRPGEDLRAARRVSFEVFFSLMERIAERVDDPALGLRAATMLHPSHLGALGHAFMVSPTLRDALNRAERYHRLVDENVRMSVSEKYGNLSACYYLEHEAKLSELRADNLLASLLQLCRINFGPGLEPVRVTMRRAAPADASPWKAVFGPGIRFGQQEDCLLLRLEDADRELTVANAYLVAVHEEILQRQMAGLDRKDVLNRTRVAIMELLPSGTVNEADVSARLGMTPRTLYNRLSEHGVSFRSLLVESRRRLAERHLQDPTYSMTEIAFLLGYSDSSAFSRAFRGWYGVPPSSFRDDRLAVMD